MIFQNLDIALNNGEIDVVEKNVGLTFPNVLRNFYLENNGGEPNPYVLRGATLHTVVNETLPLISGSGRHTAVDTYRALVLGKGIVARKYFPIAVDAGGDYFFVDSCDSKAPVYFYRADTFSEQDESLEKVAESLSEFWASLEPE